MRLSTLLAGPLVAITAQALRSDKVLMSGLKTLTLRDGQMTRHRRVDPMPQLQCVGGDAQGLYTIDVMRCKNMGSDYGDEDSISWSCTADVPKYFKLGSTDVICEGYNSPDDPYVLKGSCAVEYRLALTDEGYEKYGTKYRRNAQSRSSSDDERADWWPAVFTIIFWSVVAWIIYSAWSQRAGNGPVPPPRGQNFGRDERPWFGGGGDDDPPPPYDGRPPYSKSTTTGGQASQRGWQPGFWSGVAAGAAGAAGTSMLMGSGRDRNRDRRRPRPGPSGTGWRESSGAESSYMGAEIHETTGFGQSRRR